MITRNKLEKNPEERKNELVFRYTSNDNIIDIITSITSGSLAGIRFYLMLNLIQREGNVWFFWESSLYFSFTDKKNGDLLNFIKFPPCYRSFLAVCTQLRSPIWSESILTNFSDTAGIRKLMTGKSLLTGTQAEHSHHRLSKLWHS